MKGNESKMKAAKMTRKMKGSPVESKRKEHERKELQRKAISSGEHEEHAGLK